MSSREMVQAPRLRAVTQGSIFNHAKCQDFSVNVLGLLISARCDLAQQKQERFIYVPLVQAKDWLDHYVIPKLFAEHRSSLLAGLKNLLQQNKHCPSSIDAFGAEKSGSLLEGTKAHQAYQSKLKDLQSVEIMIQTGLYEKSLLSSKAVRSKTDELISNKIEGAFFIDNVIDFQNGSTHLGSFVAILNEPSSIQRQAALGIADGLDHDLILAAPNEFECIAALPGEMSYVMCNVRSPYIELALQRFSALYSRIGVEDPSTEMKEKLAREAVK